MLASPLYGCPTFVNGACYGGQEVPGFSPLQLATVPHTNFVPRMSNGVELQVILPIINAPMRLYYAYNPLRLYEDVPQQLAVSNTVFRSHVPELGRGPVQLPAGAAVVRRVVPTARTEEDLPVDGGNDVLSADVAGCWCSASEIAREREGLRGRGNPLPPGGYILRGSGLDCVGYGVVGWGKNKIPLGLLLNSSPVRG